MEIFVNMKIFSQLIPKCKEIRSKTQFCLYSFTRLKKFTSCFEPASPNEEEGEDENDEGEWGDHPKNHNERCGTSGRMNYDKHDSDDYFIIHNLYL